MKIHDFKEQFPPFISILHRVPIYVNKQLGRSMKKIFTNYCTICQISFFLTYLAIMIAAWYHILKTFFRKGAAGHFWFCSGRVVL